MSEPELSKDGQALLLMIISLPMACLGFLFGSYSYYLIPGEPAGMATLMGFVLMGSLFLAFLKELNDIYNGPEYITVPVSKIQPINQGTVELYVMVTKDEYEGLFRHREYTPEQREKVRKFVGE
jgi:hypothetical protein